MWWWGHYFWNPSGISKPFWFTIFPGRGSSNGFHLVFLTIIALTPPTRDNVGIQPPAENIYSNYTFLNWGNNYRLVLGAELKFHWLHDLQKPYSDLWITVTFGFPGISSSLEPVANSPWNVELFPFPQCTITLEKGHQTLGKAGRKINFIHFDSSLGSFLRGTHSPLHLRGSGHTNWLRSGNSLMSYDSLFL
jgi:hypothetical protein